MPLSGISVLLKNGDKKKEKRRQERREKKEKRKRKKVKVCLKSMAIKTVNL